MTIEIKDTITLYSMIANIPCSYKSPKIIPIIKDINCLKNREKVEYCYNVIY